jgi:hypothetical protein
MGFLVTEVSGHVRWMDEQLLRHLRLRLMWRRDP